MDAGDAVQDACPRALTLREFGYKGYKSVGSSRKRLSWRAFLIVLGLAGAAGASFWALSAGPAFTSVTGEGSIDIATSDLQPDHAKFFSYRDHAGKEIRFLLARDSSGRLHATIDACNRCYAYRQGYTSSHGELICRFCGNHYKLQAMESGLASCVPVKLPFQMARQTIRIKTAELEHSRELF